MPFATPVISQVSGGVLDHADSNASELLSAPVRESAFTFVLRLLDLGPVCNTERNVSHPHRYILLVMPTLMGGNLRLSRSHDAPALALSDGPRRLLDSACSY